MIFLVTETLWRDSRCLWRNDSGIPPCSLKHDRALKALGLRWACSVISHPFYNVSLSPLRDVDNLFYTVSVSATAAVFWGFSFACIRFDLQYCRYAIFGEF